MKMEYIKSFIAINKYKSLTKAAKELYVSQPTLSNRITSLESYLNVKLLERSWGGVELTAHGVAFLTHALNMIDKLNNFEKIVYNYEKFANLSYIDSIDKMNSTFKIGINSTLVNRYGAHIMESLNNQFPTLKYEIIPSSTTELMNLFENNMIDYMIYYDYKSRYSNTQMIKNVNLLMVLSNKDYNKVADNLWEIHQLESPLLLNGNLILDMYLYYYEKTNFNIKSMNIKMVKSMELMRLLIRNEEGYTILPESLCEQLCDEDPLLHKLYIPNSFPSMNIYSTFNQSINEYGNEFEMYAKYLDKIISNNYVSNNDQIKDMPL